VTRASCGRHVLAVGTLFLVQACDGRAASESARPYPDAPEVAQAPCPLGGVWEVRLENGTDPRHRAAGWIAITDSTGPRGPADERSGRAAVARWRGQHDIDMDSLFRPGEGGFASTTVMEGSEEDVRSGLEAGFMPAGDSVGMALLPFVSHGPLNLYGQLRGDSISGRWIQRTNEPSVPQGSLLMIRREGCSSG
jgi:hypothetical protein